MAIFFSRIFGNEAEERNSGIHHESFGVRSHVLLLQFATCYIDVLAQLLDAWISFVPIVSTAAIWTCSRESFYRTGYHHQSICHDWTPEALSKVSFCEFVNL